MNLSLLPTTVPKPGPKAQQRPDQQMMVADPRIWRRNLLKRGRVMNRLLFLHMDHGHRHVPKVFSEFGVKFCWGMWQDKLELCNLQHLWNRGRRKTRREHWTTRGAWLTSAMMRWNLLVIWGTICVQQVTRWCFMNFNCYLVPRNVAHFHRKRQIKLVLQGWVSQVWCPQGMTSIPKLAVVNRYCFSYGNPLLDRKVEHLENMRKSSRSSHPENTFLMFSIILGTFLFYSPNA